MNMTVKTTGCQYPPFTGDSFRTGSYDDFNTVLRVWITCFADSADPAIQQSHVSLVDAGMVNDQCIGDDSINSTLLSGSMRVRCSGMCFSQ